MKAPVQVAAELRLALSTATGDFGPGGAGRPAAEAAIQTITAMVRQFQAEVAKELATGGYWPMHTAPTEDGARILGLVDRSAPGASKPILEPRVMVRRDHLWLSVPGKWTGLVVGWRPVPAEDIVADGPTGGQR